MFKQYNIIFIIFLISGTLIAISSNSWFICWIGLEINLISIIPLILYNLNFSFTEAAIKYFLAQAMASLILILAACVDLNFYNSNFNSYSNSILTLSLCIKAGIAPVHFWFPQIIILIDWIQCTFILTWQRIAPLFLISSFYGSNFTLFFVFLSGLVGSFGGFNQILAKIIFTYSSIIHSGWIVILATVSTKFVLLYFIIYATLTIAILSPFYFKNLNNVSSLGLSKMSLTTKLIICIRVISLGGLPPFLGFAAKISAINLALHITPSIIIFSLVIFSLLSLFYYFKLTYNFLALHNNTLSITNYNSHININTFLSLSIMANLIFSILIVFN